MVTSRLPPRTGDLMGRKVGGYRIDSVIGEGGMGAVYGATNPMLDQRAAVKVMLEEYTRNTDIVERFFREAKAVARVEDPNIIEIWDADRFAEDGRMYILMPFIEGTSLESLCEQMGPMPLDVAGAIILQVCSGLDSVHAVSIVHRDIKCQNILIARRHRRRYFAIIVDFGIAKLLDAFAGKDGLTRTHSVLGTAGSMAPEQARGERNVDARADVFAVGNMLYRMLTGRTRYRETNLYTLIENQIKNVPFPRPRELRPDLPQVLEDAIMGALEFDPKRRIGSMKDLAQMVKRGIPNGDEMIRQLAPGLASTGKLGPAEATLTGDLEDSIRRWSSAPPSSPKRGSRYAAIAGVAFAAAAAGGVVAVKAAKHSEHDDHASGSSAEVVARGIGSSGVNAPAQPPADAAVAVAVTTASDAPALEPMHDAAVVARTVDAGDQAATPPRDASPPGAKHPQQTVVTRPQPQPNPATVAQSKTGTLLVKVLPYAEVYVDGTSLGTTPIRDESLSVGTHHVKLVSGDKTEEVDVKIEPGKPITISRSW
jgi:serine/threonine protein kinase